MAGRAPAISPERYGLTESILGSEAREFAKSELERSGRLGRRLAEKLSASPGQIITDLPDDAASESIISFNDSIPCNGQAMYGHMHDFAMALVKNYLTHSGDSVAIFNTLAHPSDPWIKNYGPQFLTYGTDVYLYLLHADRSESGIKRAFRHRGAFPGIVAFTRGQHSETRMWHRHAMSDLELTGLAAHTQFVMVEAFDQDGFVLWSTSSTDQ